MARKKRKKVYAASRAHSTAREGKAVGTVDNENAREEPGELGRKKTFLFITLGLIVLTGLYFFIRTVFLPVRKTDFKNLNVILITIDTLRADHVGAYKNGKADTPTLDTLAGEGVLFERCITQTPLTLPSHTTILSGTFPLYHRVRDNGGFLVPGKLQLVSEVLKENGFSTAAFVGAFVLHSKWGLNQGFDFYSDRFDASRYGKILLENDRPAGAVLGDASQWIVKNKDKRFFTWIHLYDPHSPYRPPAPFAGKHPDSPYRDEVEYTDHELGKFFDFLKINGLYDRSLIIAVSDHGESLGEHGEMEHGFFLYEPTVHVPLIIRAPTTFAVEKVTGTVELADVAPTILDIIGIPIPASYQGESLLKLMKGQKQKRSGNAYAETYYPRLHFGWSALKVLYNEKKKYISAPEEELYNLDTDSREKNNLALANPSESLNLRKKLWNFQVQRSKNALVPGAAANMDKKDLDRLRSLGYVTGTASVDANSSGGLPDPKVKIGVYNDFKESETLVNTGKFDEAIQRLSSVIASDPAVTDAHVLLGHCYQNKGMYNEALNCFYPVLEMKPDYNFVMIDTAASLMALRDYEKAESELQRFLKRFPDDYLLHEMLGNVYYYQRDYEKALAAFNRSIEIEPGNAAALERIGAIYIARNEPRKAQPYIEKAASINPQLKESNFSLALIAEESGNLDKAIEFYIKEIETNPGNFKASYNLAEDLRKLGKYEQAIPYYRKTIEWNPNLKMPYFLVAGYFLEKKDHLTEAIELCKKGIAIAPEDKQTLFGYYIITNIYALMGDNSSLSFYTEKGERLNQKLQNQVN
jgi:arylsulfatase A-like enzyme/Tfp pilus assembly protein PilF